MARPTRYTPCRCVKRHVPPQSYSQVHHIVPLSWGGPDVESNMVALCGTTHDAIHDVLNVMVRRQTTKVGTLGSAPARRYARMAIERYQATHDGKLPTKGMLTLAHPKP